MKKIVIPTDFSDNAWSAIIYALKLFKDVECTFFFLHSTKIKVSMMSNLSNKLIDVMTKNAIEDLKKLQAQVEKTNANPKHTFKVLVSNHDLEQATNIAINNHDIDLVVMGTKGISGTKGTLFGSNTVAIISKIRNCPILAVPDVADFKTPMHIGFPTDLNRNYNDTLIEPIKEMALINNSEVKIMHIDTEAELTEKQQKNLDALTMFLDMNKVTSSYVSMADYADKTREITDFIFDFDIDLLIMIRHRHSFFEKLVREPVIKRLGHHVHIPFLVIPEQ